VSPDGSGNVLINFSTTADGDWGFNAGIIIHEYTDATGGVVLNSELDSSFSVQDELYRIKMYPNPFTDVINVDINNNTSSNRITADIYDITGRLATRQEFDYLPAGFNTIAVRTSGVNMPAGMYVMSIRINGQIISTKQLLKQK
jgi:hypothetical protein